MNRTIGITLTALTVLCCACPGLFLCIFGGFIAFGVPLTTTLNGTQNTQTYPPTYGIIGLCLALILVAIPFIVGFITYRIRPKPVSPVVVDFNGPIPPAS